MLTPDRKGKDDNKDKNIHNEDIQVHTLITL